MGIQESFRALSDPNRRQILDLLKEGRMSAGELLAHFAMTGATLSHHLSLLKKANLVRSEKEGKFIYYELNMTVTDELIAWLSALKEGASYENERQQELH